MHPTRDTLPLINLKRAGRRVMPGVRRQEIIRKCRRRRTMDFLWLRVVILCALMSAAVIAALIVVIRNSGGNIRRSARSAVVIIGAAWAVTFLLYMSWAPPR
jgi:hypothetical protein